MAIETKLIKFHFYTCKYGAPKYASCNLNWLIYTFRQDLQRQPWLSNDNSKPRLSTKVRSIDGINVELWMKIH